MMPKTDNLHSILLVTLLLGFIIRITLVWNQGLTLDNQSGGDALWYIVNGYGLFMPEPTGIFLDVRFAVNSLGVAPLYLIFLGLMQQFWQYPLALLAIRVLQVIMSMLVCYFAYDLGKLLTDDRRVGLVAAIALTTSIVFTILPGLILTETLYITFFTAGIWFYCKYIIPQIDHPRWLLVVIAGILFGLATLTRAVGILFPLGIAAHIIIVTGRQHWKRGLQLASVIVLAYGMTISTWTLYNLVQYNRFIIISNQFFPALWRGATDEDGSPAENDALLGEQTAREQSTEIIASNPAGFIELRLRELTYSYLQPYGTLFFKGESVKALVVAWLDSGLTISGLQRMVTAEAFVPKLLIYIWHYVALVGGLVGMWLTRKNWHMSLVMVGFILYTTLLHFVLIALPRYIYPTTPFFWIFAAVALVKLWDVIQDKTKGQPETAPK